MLTGATHAQVIQLFKQSGPKLELLVQRSRRSKSSARQDAEPEAQHQLPRQRSSSYDRAARPLRLNPDRLVPAPNSPRSPVMYAVSVAQRDSADLHSQPEQGESVRAPQMHQEPLHKPTRPSHENSTGLEESPTLRQRSASYSDSVSNGGSVDGKSLTGSTVTLGSLPSYDGALRDGARPPQQRDECEYGYTPAPLAQQTREAVSAIAAGTARDEAFLRSGTPPSPRRAQPSAPPPGSPTAPPAPPPTHQSYRWQPHQMVRQQQQQPHPLNSPSWSQQTQWHRQCSPMSPMSPMTPEMMQAAAAAAAEQQRQAAQLQRHRAYSASCPPDRMRRNPGIKPPDPRIAGLPPPRPPRAQVTAAVARRQRSNEYTPPQRSFAAGVDEPGMAGNRHWGPGEHNAVREWDPAHQQY